MILSASVKRVSRIVLSCSVLLFLGGCLTTTGSQPSLEDQLGFSLRKKDYQSKFGIMSPGPGGKFRVYAETNYIYRNVDPEYVHGFEVVRKDDTRFMAYYEIRFPEPITISKEMERAVTVLEGGRLIRSLAEVYWGLYSSPFWFSADDPIGEYELTIFIDGEKYREIRYQVAAFEGSLEF